jgi:hypothetical protein
VSGFSFSLPAAAVVGQLFVTVRHAAVHTEFTTEFFTTCTTPFPRTGVGGTTLKAILDGNIVSLTFSPQNSTTLGTCASYTVTLADRDFDFANFIPSVASLNSEGFTLLIQGTYPTTEPASFLMVKHFIDSVAITAGYGLDTSTLLVDQATLTRVRSGALALVNGERYISRYTSTSVNKIVHSNGFVIVEVSG